jgi:hypothetical protein
VILPHDPLKLTPAAARVLLRILRTADPTDKAELYAQLGLRLTFNPGPKTVTVRLETGQSCTKGSCPRGECTQKPMRPRW